MFATLSLIKLKYSIINSNKSIVYGIFILKKQYYPVDCCPKSKRFPAPDCLVVAAVELEVMVVLEAVGEPAVVVVEVFETSSPAVAAASVAV